MASSVKCLRTTPLSTCSPTSSLVNKQRNIRIYDRLKTCCAAAVHVELGYCKPAFFLQGCKCYYIRTGLYAGESGKVGSVAVGFDVCTPKKFMPRIPTMVGRESVE